MTYEPQKQKNRFKSDYIAYDYTKLCGFSQN